MASQPTGAGYKKAPLVKNLTKGGDTLRLRNCKSQTDLCR
jgi:hypothetical protein